MELLVKFAVTVFPVAFPVAVFNMISKLTQILME
jgi:hypothetical protein